MRGVIIIAKSYPNKYILHDEESYAEIIVTSGKWGSFSFDIDLNEVERCKKYHWSLFRVERCKGKNLNIYAYNIKTKTFLHRYIANASKDKFIDHIDGNTFNNRKSNLRECTNEENLRNRKKEITNKSGHTGVIWSKKDNRWMAYIMENYHHHTLGYFKNIDDAVACRKRAEIKYFGEFKSNRN